MQRIRHCGKIIQNRASLLYPSSLWIILEAGEENLRPRWNGVWENTFFIPSQHISSYELIVVGIACARLKNSQTDQNPCFDREGTHALLPLFEELLAVDRFRKRESRFYHGYSPLEAIYVTHEYHNDCPNINLFILLWFLKLINISNSPMFLCKLWSINIWILCSVLLLMITLTAGGFCFVTFYKVREKLFI